MDKYVSEETSQETELATLVTVAMSLLVNPQGFARIMDNGLQRNQPASVWVCKLILEC